MKKASLIALMLVCWGVSMSCQWPPKNVATTRSSGSLLPAIAGNLALSLKVLNAKLEACQREDSCGPEVTQLAGLKKIFGFVADEKNDDLVLFGEADPQLPPLYVEDLVIALRSAWLKYAERKGNVLTYSHPGCSIDPSPEVMRELQSFESRMPPIGSDERAKALDEWRKICRKPQTVRVLGIPFDTRFAKVLVTADYDLKKLADGTDTLDVPGFASILDMRIGMVRDAIARNQRAVLTPSSMNRFWFYPDENLYEESEGIVLIKQSPVKLLTEQMYASAGGEMKGSGGTDATAQVFADNFTLLYDEIAGQRPVYQEMESLFRFVSLAQAIKFKHPNLAEQFGLSYLLDGYQVPTTRLKRELPGRDAVKDFQHRDETRQTLFQNLSCGGVDIAIEANAGNFRPDTLGLPTLKDSILGSRMALDKLYWTFEDKSGVLGRIKDIFLLRERNRLNDHAEEFLVEDTDAGYVVTGTETSKKFAINEFPQLVGYVNGMVKQPEVKGIILKMKGFNMPAKAEGFMRSCNIQQKAQKSGLALYAIPRRNDSVDWYNDPRVKHELADGRPPEIEEETEQGEHKGWFKASIRVNSKYRDKSTQTTLTVLGKSRSAVQQFIDEITTLLSKAYGRVSLWFMVHQARKGKDVKVKISEQAGPTYFGKLNLPAGAEAAE